IARLAQAASIPKGALTRPFNSGIILRRFDAGMHAMSIFNREFRTTDNRLVASLPVWLRSLWSQVLFPGTADCPTHVRLSAILILFFVPGVLLYPTLNFPLFEPDEGRYAEIPREMLLRGELVVPYLQSEPYLDKPPLLYWLVMLSYQHLGVS